MHNSRGIAIGQVYDTNHAGYDTQRIEVVKSGFVIGCIDLRHHTYQQFFLLRLLNQSERRGTANQYWHEDMRKNHHVAQRQDGNLMFQIIPIDRFIRRCF